MSPEIQQIASVIEHAVNEAVHIVIQVVVYTVGLVEQAIQNWKG